MSDIHARESWPKVPITDFPNLVAVKGVFREVTWPEFIAERNKNVGPFAGAQQHPLWSAAHYRNDSRAAPSEVLGVSMLVYDFDGDSDADLSTPADIFPGLAIHWHTTKKHTPDCPRFRMTLPLSRMVTPEEHAKLWVVVERRIRASGFKVDPQTKDPGRLWYAPSLPREGAYIAHEQAGSPLDVDAMLQEWVDDASAGSEGRSTRPVAAGGTSSSEETILGRAFAELGWVRRRLPNGALAVVCPNAAEHTSGTPNDPNDSSTVIFPSTSRSGIGGFHCSHAHCAHLTSREVLKLLPEDVLARAGWTRARSGGADTEGRRPSIADALVQLAAERCELFHTPDERHAYAIVETGELREVLPIRSSQFRAFLGRLAYLELGKVPNGSAIGDVCAVLEAKARYEHDAREVHVRIAAHEERIFIDLGHGQRVVCLSREGWELTDAPPVLFYRPEGMQPLPAPVRGGSIEELRPFINASDVGFRMIVGTLVSWFRPRGPYLLLVLTGEQGTGKSTTARVIKSLIDPGRAALRALSRDVRDLMIAGRSMWLLVFDNLSGLTAEMSDALSRMSTGGGFATRQLHTDLGQVLFDLVRPVMLNGIDESFGRADLQDRAITIVLPVLDGAERRDEATFWRDFEAVRPRVFGALLDAVVMALRRFDTVQLSRKPRMADPARWVTAAEPALGWEEGTFVGAMFDNQKEAARVGVDADVIASGVAELMRNRDKPWSGTMTMLQQDLAGVVPDSVKFARDFPKTAAQLGSRLRRSAPGLRRMGIEIAYSRHGSLGQRWVEIDRRAVSPSATDHPDTPTATSTAKGGADAADVTDDADGIGEDTDFDGALDDEIDDQQRLDSLLAFAEVVPRGGRR